VALDPAAARRILLRVFCLESGSSPALGRRSAKAPWTELAELPLREARRHFQKSH
jgi:hypothetical protein